MILKSVTLNDLVNSSACSMFMPKCFGKELGEHIRHCLKDHRKIIPCEFIPVIPSGIYDYKQLWVLDDVVILEIIGQLKINCWGISKIKSWC